MIKFALSCERGHAFESWFPDGESYDAQACRGLVQCPDCDSRRIGKAPMAPAVHGGRRAERSEPDAAAPVVLIDEKHRELRAALGAMRKMIEARTEDVGAKFPEIARAIHVGDAPERAIRGEATLAEVKGLIEDGIGVMPLPIAPDQAN
jgi:hypothetical protein